MNQCTRCFIKYRTDGGRNVGEWKCRMHPGEAEDGKWTCCGAKTTVFVVRTLQGLMEDSQHSGCRRCDHSHLLQKYQDIVPYAAGAHLVIPEAIVAITTTDELIDCDNRLFAVTGVRVDVRTIPEAFLNGNAQNMLRYIKREDF